jgi:hypothetical protein
MVDRTKTYADAGMMIGLYVGAGLAVILYGVTGSGAAFALIGICMVLGLAFGSGVARPDGTAPRAEGDTEG